MTNDLSTPQLLWLRAVARPAIVLLALSQLEAPTGPLELAEILGINQHTVARYLGDLLRLGLAGRSAYRAGFVITPAGRDFLLGSLPGENLVQEELAENDQNAQKRPFEPTITTTVNINPIDSKDSEIVVTAASQARIFRVWLHQAHLANRHRPNRQIQAHQIRPSQPTRATRKKCTPWPRP